MSDNKKFPKELEIPKPPERYNKNIKVKISKDDVANVNLFMMACDCDEYKSSNRSEYEKSDIRRMCRHIAKLYKKKIRTDKIDSIKTMMIESGEGIKPSIIYLESEELGYSICIAFQIGLPWIDVYAKNINGIYKKHVYNYSNKEWQGKISYNKELIDALESFILENIQDNSNAKANEKKNGEERNYHQYVEIPELSEEYNKDIIVKEDNKKYKLNLFKMECSCKEFDKKKHYRLGDSRRMCFHLRREFWNTTEFKKLNKLEQTLIKNNYGNKDNLFIFELKNDLSFAISYDDDREEYSSWYNVIARKNNGQYICYAYNPYSKRWAKDKNPELYKEEIENLVNSIDIFAQKDIDEEY